MFMPLQAFLILAMLIVISCFFMRADLLNYEQ